jgi:DNA-binding MarR family transcriptional regulator
VTGDEQDKQDKQDFVRFLQTTADRTATERLILLTYVTLSSDERGGIVNKTGVELAKLLNLAPTVFSRLRRQLVEDGYLEESPQHRLGNIRYYRLTAKVSRGSGTVVIPLRRTAT